jgi:hypothetical protein
MARLLYVTNMSLDGYIEDEDGNSDFTAPGDDIFEFSTDLVRPVGTYLYGRRLYESMAVWETQPGPGVSIGADGGLRQRLADDGQSCVLNDPELGLDLQHQAPKEFRTIRGPRSQGFGDG